MAIAGEDSVGGSAEAEACEQEDGEEEAGSEVSEADERETAEEDKECLTDGGKSEKEGDGKAEDWESPFTPQC